MTDTEATVYAALIATGGALFGGFLGAAGSYLAQRTLLSSQTREHAYLDLLQKRLVSLQNLVFALDFIEGNVGNIKGGPLGDLFVHIAKNNACNIAFFPEEIREDARKVIHIYYTALRSENLHIDGDFLTDVKRRALNLVDSTYDRIKNG